MVSQTDFELLKYVDQSTNESDVYGSDHQFVYEAGNATDPYGHRVAIVEIKVGGQIRYEEPAGRVAVRGFMAFPPTGAAMDAELRLDEDPSQEQMLEIAGQAAALLISGTALLKKSVNISG
jgi:hypothetical protein